MFGVLVFSCHQNITPSPTRLGGRALHFTRMRTLLKMLEVNCTAVLMRICRRKRKKVRGTYTYLTSKLSSELFLSSKGKSLRSGSLVSNPSNSDFIVTLTSLWRPKNCTSERVLMAVAYKQSGP